MATATAITTLDARLWALRQRTLRERDPWARTARPKQLPPPGEWRYWLLMAGRGYGKTRTAAEYIRAEVMAGRTREIGLIAATAADVRDVVVEGPSGIIKVCERYGWRVRYEPSKQRITFPTGAIARTRSADEPDRIRGPEFDLAWWDEFGTWKQRDAYSNADLGLRRPGPNGERSRAIVSFTPKPTVMVRELVKRPDVVLVSGHTDENAANLDAATLASYYHQYGGTRLGRQELAGELLLDTPGALWTLALIEAHRLDRLPESVSLVRVVVAVDPAVTADEDSNETGIVVAAKGSDGRGYVLEDLSGQYKPIDWARVAVNAYHRWQADRIVAEVNNGGLMVGETIATVDADAAYKAVTASRGKQTRAEPISALYEQGRISHVGMFAALEGQMTEWVPGMDSPDDRVDALVWAGTECWTDGITGSLGAFVDNDGGDDEDGDAWDS